MNMNTRAHGILGRSKKMFSTMLGRQLSKISQKESEIQNTKKLRQWIVKNILIQYKLNATEASRVVNGLYGASRDCDVSSFADFVQGRPEVFDIFGDDLTGTLDIVLAWYDKKNAKITTAPVLVGAALYCQLSLMGARSVPGGFGGNDLIRANKVERARLAKIKEAKLAEAMEAKNKLAEMEPVVPEDTETALRASIQTALMAAPLADSWDSDDE